MSALQGAIQQMGSGTVRTLNVHDYGATGDGTTDDTAAIQAALDDACGVRKLVYVPAGTYILTVAGANTYTTVVGNNYCLDIKCDYTTLRLMPGATLKLGNGEQTDAGGPVDIIVMNARKNITIEGGGRITGNTAGQTGYTGGYWQGEHGVIIGGYDGCQNITIKDLTLDDHFSNPIDFYGSSPLHQGITLDNLIGLNCGEGFQVSAANNVIVTNSTYTDNAGVTVGDSFELAGCSNWLCDGCTSTIANGYALGGSGFDLTGSQNGILSNFVVNGGPSAVDIQGISYQEINNVTVTNGTITNITNTGVYVHNESHPDAATNATISNLTISPRAGATIIGFQIAPNNKVTGPVTISSVNVTATGGTVTNAYNVKSCTDLTISGGTVTGCNYGIVHSGYQNAASDADLVGQLYTGITFVGTVTRDIYFSNSGATKNPTGTISNCTWTNDTPTKRLFFEQSTMLLMTVSNAAPYTYDSYGGTAATMQPWAKDIVTPINNRTWAQMLYGNVDQVLTFNFSGTETFVDKTQAGGVNISLAGSVNFAAAPGRQLVLQFDTSTLDWVEVSRV